jgi:hypothetical protein
MKNNNNGKNNGLDIEALLAQNPNITPAPALADAIAEMQKQEREEAKVMAIGRLQTVAATKKAALEKLRSLRLQETAQKNYLSEIGAAESAFFQSGDWDACKDAMANATKTLCERQQKANRG